MMNLYESMTNQNTQLSLDVESLIIAQRFCLPAEPNDLAHHPEEPPRKGDGQGLER
jgi:hypothetical protein